MPKAALETSNRRRHDEEAEQEAQAPGAPAAQGLQEDP